MRSRAVRARAFAPKAMEARPFSDFAAALDSSECQGVGQSVMQMVGWMVGTAWDTLPTSLEPMPQPEAGGSMVSPSSESSLPYTASKEGVGTIFATRFW